MQKISDSPKTHSFIAAATPRIPLDKDGTRGIASIMPGTLLTWSKLAGARWEDAWKETLRYLGPERLATFVFAGGTRVRLQVYSLRESEARELVERFGGSVRPQASTREIIRRNARREAINIRGRLILVDEPDRVAREARRRPGADVMCVPAGVAFGTGEHATTATCLRLLVDLARERQGSRWVLLDLGTGSGVLAMAARKLGAASVEGCDYDADAVRTARENAAANGLSRIRFVRRDVTRWVPGRRFDVVTANLYHAVLLKAAGAIAAAVAKDGMLVLSGILRVQEWEVVEGFGEQGLGVVKVVRKGKWVTLLCRRQGLFTREGAQEASGRRYSGE